ncbi:MAG: hypothetical protein WAZ19_01920 [Anaerolineae bacterium]
MTLPTSNLNWSLVGFALSLLIPSTAVFQKYLGITGVVAYITIAFFALLLFAKYRYIPGKLASKVTEKQTSWLAVMTVVIVLIAFVVVYPVANSGIVGGGSDGDEALNTATTELLHGRYPYYPRTYLGNPISPLPGALLFAIPFVLLGNSAYQNFFWLIVFIIAMKSYLKDGYLALLLLWVIFALSPIVLYQFLIGSDYISNSIYILLLMLWMVTSISQTHLSSWKKALLAFLLGIGLSSRANFILLLPLIFSAMVQQVGWRSATKYTAITIITFVVITVPFYLYDPQGFSPLHTANKLGQFQSIIPLAGLVIPLSTGILALTLAFFQSKSRNFSILLRNCTIVLAFPVLCGILFSMIKSGKIDLSFASFGTFFLFFGAVAFWSNLLENVEMQRT